MRVIALLFLTCLLGSSAFAKPQPVGQITAKSYALALFQRVIGVPGSPTSSLILKMTELVEKGDYAGAVQVAYFDRRFYSVRMRNFSAQYTNINSSPAAEFDDLQALFIGITRDKRDARELLTADYRYEAWSNLGLPAVSLENNLHYTAFENQGLDYFKDLQYVKDQWPGFDEAAGALTTRSWGKAYFLMGTNRRSVQYAMQHFLCVAMDQWKDRAIPDDYVRRDVGRDRGGKPAEYQTHCRECHGGMDAFGGAFARYDFVDNKLIQLPPGKVADKYNTNIDRYPEGYITVDDSWINYSTKNHNEALGWRGPLRGMGVKSFGAMLANSKAFSQCMTRRLFTEICNRAPHDSENELVESLATQFESNGYKIQSLVTQIAIQPACLEHP